MQLPAGCYDELLVGNESNAIEPWGYPIFSDEAVRLVRNIQFLCPTTGLVVGNVSADDWGQGSGENAGR